MFRDHDPGIRSYIDAISDGDGGCKFAAEITRELDRDYRSERRKGIRPFHPAGFPPRQNVPHKSEEVVGGSGMSGIFHG